MSYSPYHIGNQLITIRHCFTGKSETNCSRIKTPTVIQQMIYQSLFTTQIHHDLSHSALTLRSLSWLHSPLHFFEIRNASPVTVAEREYVNVLSLSPFDSLYWKFPLLTTWWAAVCVILKVINELSDWLICGTDLTGVEVGTVSLSLSWVGYKSQSCKRTPLSWS